MNKKKAVEESGDEDKDATAVGAGRGSSDVPCDLLEDVLASVSKDLSNLRDEASYFTVRVLGGAWSITKRNVLYIGRELLCH